MFINPLSGVQRAQFANLSQYFNVFIKYSDRNNCMMLFLATLTFAEQLQVLRVFDIYIKHNKC